jgi:hypothetical protein
MCVAPSREASLDALVVSFQEAAPPARASIQYSSGRSPVARSNACIVFRW